MPKIDPTDLLALKQSLLSGRYNLLLGAGVNADSSLVSGARVPTSSALRTEIVALKNLRDSSSLQRAYSHLDEREIGDIITARFQDCRAGPSLVGLTQFFWRRIYTLNVDDALENAYDNAFRKQKSISLTHKSAYRNPPDVTSIQIVHVHGWVKEPEMGYVFSLTEYAAGLGPGNPWANVLAQTITSEPFIIAGTSLEEQDLEYFLNGRTPDTTRKDRGPSFLIEPYPDAGTLNDCKRYDLKLYEGTLEEFINELGEAFPVRALPSSASAGINQSDFRTPISPKDTALFSKEFSLLLPRQAEDNIDYSFYVGKDPSFDDIALERDVSRYSTNSIKKIIRGRLAGNSHANHIIIIHDSSGSGKTTTVRRCLYDLATEGIFVFVCHSTSSFDFEPISRVFSALKKPFVVYFDDFADKTSIALGIYREVLRDDMLFICSERSYRIPQVRSALGEVQFTEYEPAKFTANEAKSLIVKMNSYGLTSEEMDDRKLASYANDLISDSISIAVCRILNDFRPIERIIQSVLNDADLNRTSRYIFAAIASYCYKIGAPRSCLITRTQPVGLEDQLQPRDILPLSYTDPNDRNYIAPLNPVFGQRVLFEAIKSMPDLVFDCYCDLGVSISSFVNRLTIRNQTPEARLSARLFDYDDVVREILGERSEKFYTSMRRYWEWNSRYWEQMALMKLQQFNDAKTDKKDNIIIQAVSHAKHAVKLERHAFGLTTLGKVLVEDMKFSESRFEKSFNDAFKFLMEAARIEKQTRIAIHPYSVLFPAVSYFDRNGGLLSLNQRRELKESIELAERVFHYENRLMTSIAAVRHLIS